jgi:hypothetical protein
VVNSPVAYNKALDLKNHGFLEELFSLTYYAGSEYTHPLHIKVCNLWRSLLCFLSGRNTILHASGKLPRDLSKLGKSLSHDLVFRALVGAGGH